MLHSDLFPIYPLPNIIMEHVGKDVPRGTFSVVGFQEENFTPVAGKGEKQAVPKSDWRHL